MKCGILLLGLLLVGGCGISSIHCEIETNEELLRRVVNDIIEERL